MADSRAVLQENLAPAVEGRVILHPRHWARLPDLVDVTRLMTRTGDNAGVSP